jgi:hypothetical protein
MDVFVYVKSTLKSDFLGVWWIFRPRMEVPDDLKQKNCMALVRKKGNVGSEGRAGCMIN